MRKPKIIVSRCLDFQKCRYDGQGFNNKIVSSLKNHTDIITVCPEVEIGLSVPRETIRIEKHKNKDIYKLVQTSSRGDFTNIMNEFSEEFIGNLTDIDAFILKGKSPSCGIKDVKIYNEGNDCAIINNGNGFFAHKVLKKFSNIPVENEGRLTNYSIRDDFFTKIFLINNMKKTDNITDFHKENEVLLKSYDKEKTTELDVLIENIKRDDYFNYIYEIISTKRKKELKLNIIKDIFKRYESNLTIDEIKMFKKLVKSYEDSKIPFSTLCVAIRMYATRFNDKQILNQTFFSPYPDDLVSISDSGKSINL